MSRDSKRKLAIVAGISECLFYAEAKYCAFEIHGEPKYYVCPRTEYCCNFGCCVSPGFQIYHLWYYWLLVIIMFLVCSGGGWWYRYWLQGRYRAAASAIPSRGTPNSRGQRSLPGRTCPAQQASITYNSARNTVLLHRMWKGGPHRAPSSSSAYTGPPVGGAASSAHFQNTSVVLNDVNCPYYQLYGPPPSYETVIAQTRGKLSSPLSPERSRNVDLSSSSTGSSTLPNQDIPSRCYNHSPCNSNHPSQNGSTIGGIDSAITCYEQNTTVADAIHRLEPLETSSGFSRYPPSYVSNGDGTTPVHTAGRQDDCLPLHYLGGAVPSHDYEQGRAGIVPDAYRVYHDDNSLERLPSYHDERNIIAERTPRTNGTSSDLNERDHHHHHHQQRRSSRHVNASESHSSVPDLNIEIGDMYDRDAKTSEIIDQQDRYPRNHGGSLKFSRKRDEKNATHGSYRRDRNNLDMGSTSWANDERKMMTVAVSNSRPVTSFDKNNHYAGSFSRSTKKGLLTSENGRTSVTPYGIIDQQTNPSDNVILEPLTSVNINEGECAAGSADHQSVSSVCGRSHRLDDEDDEEHQRLVRSSDVRAIGNDDLTIVDDASINNHESKHNKLDRSKSLD